MRFEHLPGYAKQHIESPKRPGVNPDFFRIRAELIRALLDTSVSRLHSKQIRSVVSDSVRGSRSPGRGKWDCDYQSEAVINCDDPRLEVQVEHVWEVAHFVNRVMMDLQDHVSEMSFNEAAEEYRQLLARLGAFDPDHKDWVDWMDRSAETVWSTDSHSTSENMASWLQDIPTVLVSRDEHVRLSRVSIPFAVSQRLQTARPIGLNFDRYCEAQIRIAKMTDKPAGSNHLFLPCSDL